MKSKLFIVLSVLLLFQSFCYAETTMTLKNPETELSDLTSVCGDKAAMFIYSALTTDDTKIWNDFQYLKNHGISNVVVYVNSPGGYATTGFALAGVFRWAQDNGFNMTAYASGIVASAAVPVYLAFDNRKALNNVIFMIHEASTEMSGTSSQFKSQSDMFDLMREQYFNILIDRTNLKDREQWERWERDTKWIGLSEAVELGIVPKEEK